MKPISRALLSALLAVFSGVPLHAQTAIRIGAAVPGLGAVGAPLGAASAAPIPASALLPANPDAALLFAPTPAPGLVPTALSSEDRPAAAHAALEGAALQAVALGAPESSDDASKSGADAAFDGSGPQRPGEGIPLPWIDAMIARGRSADAQSRRLQDIVQRVGFRNAAINRRVLENHADAYTVEIPMGPITDQQQSGRCWIFAGLNMIRSTLLADKTAPKDFEFSENYLHFFNMLEKSNRHLEEVARKVYRRSSPKDFPADRRRMAVTPNLGDGGWYEYFAFLVSKYGLIPKSAMGETISSGATEAMLAELQDSLAATGAEMLANAKQYKAGREASLARDIQERGMTRVWKILVTHLGAPPSRFEHRRAGRTRTSGRVQSTQARLKTYTPREFARDFVKFNPNDYLSVSSYPGKKTDKVYEVRNSAIGKSSPGQPGFDLRFLNVRSERLAALAARAIRGGQPVWFAADAGRDIDHKTGIMHPDVFDRAPLYEFTPDEATPSLTRKQAAYFGRIGVNHAMVLTGLDQPDPRKPVVKFKVENSWGEQAGNKGVYHLYREWFDQNVFEIVVHKRFLSAAERKLWRGTSTEIEDWY
ncbi:MAG: hypothetical protein HY403_04950 [Elusimicrobia bacterium]|nr:hypothetical protein [Elusimicrobiota bacterium]